MAHFKTKWRTCYACNRTWEDHEEKETDVRLALKVLEDCVDGAVDRVILISGDSDLVPVVATIRRKFPRIRTFIACPPQRYAGARDLRQAAHASIMITKGRISKHRLSEKVSDSNGNVVATRPARYAPPAA